jgi:hypothetical protein
MSSAHVDDHVNGVVGLEPCAVDDHPHTARWSRGDPCGAGAKRESG